MKTTVRNSNHELLRILAMYMIVFIHANMYLGNFCEGRVWSFCNGAVNGICNIGVSCFILISGYYGIRFNFKKFIKMECMMITYSLLETAVLYAVLPERMEGAALLEQLVKSFLPFITRKYWFYSAYVCLMFFSGYLQKFIDNMDKAEFKKFLILLLVLFSILPTVFYFEQIPDNGKGVVQMIMVYMIGRYLRMYQEIKISKMTGVLFFFLWLINGISHEFPIQIGGIYHHLCKDNSITNLIMAVILFSLFQKLNFHSAFINKSAGYIFAVFALNNTLVSAFMKICFRNEWLSGLPTGGSFGFLILAGIVFFILLFCLMIGALREALLGKLDSKLGEVLERIRCTQHHYLI